MAVALLTIAEEMVPFVKEWTAEFDDKSWRVVADYSDDSLMFATGGDFGSVWPFVSRHEICNFGPSAASLARHFADRARQIMMQDRDIKARKKGTP